MQHIAFTLSVIAAAIGAYLFPAAFTSIAGQPLQPLIKPLLQMTMFGMGATMAWRDFAAVAMNPKGVAIGLVCQFTIMPIVGFSLSRTFGFEPEIAAGVVLIGCAPSGLASNVISYIAKANVPLSITLTACATLMAPIATPLLMKLLGGTLVEVDVAAMMWEIVQIVLLPIGAGLVINHALGPRARYLHRVLPIVSMAGIVAIVGIITAAGSTNLAAVGLSLAACVLLHNLLGFAIGYGVAKLCRLSERDARTISIEVGMQNGGLATGLAKAMGKVATTGLAPIVFATIMNVTGSALAAVWAKLNPATSVSTTPVADFG